MLYFLLTPPECCLFYVTPDYQIGNSIAVDLETGSHFVPGNTDSHIGCRWNVGHFLVHSWLMFFKDFADTVREFSRVSLSWQVFYMM